MKKLLSLTLALALLAGLTACGGAAPSSGAAPAESTPAESTPDGAEETDDAADTASARPDTDPSGAPITLPEQIGSIVTLAPSLSQTVVDLGHGEDIVAYDLNSVGLPGLDADAPTFDTVAPDVEALVALDPDLLLVSNLSLYDQEAPYQPLIDAGVCVVCVPTSDSLADIEADITFLAAILGEEESGARLVEGMESEFSAVADIAATIPAEERKSVYFEISAAPYMYSFGSGVYLNELLELLGAENILAGESGWLSVEAETVVAADPDVILTNVNYLDDPVQEILDRDGWAGVTAVAAGEVHAIDNMASSLPNEGVTAALRQMAAALYPDYYVDAAA